MVEDARVAYFTMEIALSDSIPTYSGGLGVLAGDYLRSSADLGLPVEAVTLLYKGGYFVQHVAQDGRQEELAVDWTPEQQLERLSVEVTVEIAGRSVRLRAWRLVLSGESGGEVPVYFLDSDVEGNDAEARALTDQLYGGDGAHRLAQEAVLGLGGTAFLAALGREPVKFHMNEGHSALLVLSLLERYSLDEVRRSCVFTTHTPVPAGHDRFATKVVSEILGKGRTSQLEELGLLGVGELNMTELGIAGSGYVNAVSLRHGEVTREMFPGVDVFSVTNGVHASSWTGPHMAELFDSHVPTWRADNAALRYISFVACGEIERAHLAAKRALLLQVGERTGRRLDEEILTIGVARRATTYKQTTLLLSDLDRLVHISESIGPLEVLYAGKAHPRDEEGKALIEQIVRAGEKLSGAVEVVFLQNYDLELARLLVAGTDIWLNTPLKPNEASGTSGMKAALNGVPSLSVPDGWWIEGCVEGVTGWAVGTTEEGDDAADLYAKLEGSVLPAYYESSEGLAPLRRGAISLNGSFFTTERMAREYARAAYQLTSL